MKTSKRRIYYHTLELDMPVATTQDAIECAVFQAKLEGGRGLDKYVLEPLSSEFCVFWHASVGTIYLEAAALEKAPAIAQERFYESYLAFMREDLEAARNVARYPIGFPSPFKSIAGVYALAKLQADACQAEYGITKAERDILYRLSKMSAYKALQNGSAEDEAFDETEGGIRERIKWQ